MAMLPDGTVKCVAHMEENCQECGPLTPDKISNMTVEELQEAHKALTGHEATSDELVDAVKKDQDRITAGLHSMGLGKRRKLHNANL